MDAGVLLTVLGLSALPVSASVGYVSRWVSDRNIVLASVAASSLGCLALALRTHAALYYFGGGTLIFMGTLIMEGAGMSLLSKVIHPRLAHGLLNAGETALLPGGPPGLSVRTFALDGCLSMSNSLLINLG